MAFIAFGAQSLNVKLKGDRTSQVASLRTSQADFGRSDRHVSALPLIGITVRHRTVEKPVQIHRFTIGSIIIDKSNVIPNICCEIRGAVEIIGKKSQLHSIVSNNVM